MIRLILILLSITVPAMAYDSGPHLPTDIGGTLDTMNEPGAGPGVYGDLSGYKRVLGLEKQLTTMTPGGHPRLFLTPSLISQLVDRSRRNSTEWQTVKQRADDSKDNIQDNALVALTLAHDTNSFPNGWNDSTVQNYVQRVIDGIVDATGEVWPANPFEIGVSHRSVAVWSLGLDWVYNGLTAAERQLLINKIASHVDFRSAYEFWDNRSNEIAIRKETFHREGWAFYSWNQWPEIVIAGHNTTTNPNCGDEALSFSKRRWAYDTSYGDALRWIVYQNDGQPMEGYQHGTVAIGWFIPLATAYGIDAWHTYMEAAAEQSLYELDLSPGANRMVFHYGYSGDLGGIYSLDTDARSPWRQRDYMMRGASYFNTNLYQQWFLENVLQIGTNLGSVSWLFSQEYYIRWEDFEPLADFIWFDPTSSEASPVTADYPDLPTGKVWGTHRGISRTGWGDNETIFELRARSVTTRTSHSIFDAASFQIYRDGNLSADTGVYDALWSQTMVRKYTATTLATNGLLLVDKENPGLPATAVGGTTENFGGVEGASMRTFGYKYSIGTLNANKSGTVSAHSSYADEARIVASNLHEKWDWFAADATLAYKDRASEFTRQALVIKYENNNAVIAIFDRVEAPTTHEKVFVQHYHDDPFTVPTVAGKLTDTQVEVPNRILNYKTDEILRISAHNPDKTYILHTFKVLPRLKTLRIVGGRGTEGNCNEDGYDFYLNGSSPRNSKMDWWPNSSDCMVSHAWEIIPYFQQFANVSPDNWGTWRSEFKAQSQTSRDYFLTVMYSAAPDDPIPTLELVGDNGVEITTAEGSATLLFYKTGKLGGQISLDGAPMESFGEITILDPPKNLTYSQ